MLLHIYSIFFWLLPCCQFWSVPHLRNVALSIKQCRKGSADLSSAKAILICERLDVSLLLWNMAPIITDQSGTVCTNGNNVR